MAQLKDHALQMLDAQLVRNVLDICTQLMEEQAEAADQRLIVELVLTRGTVMHYNLPVLHLT